MPIYNFSAADQSGKIIKGQKEVESEKMLAESLKREGLLLLRVKEKGKDGSDLGFINRLVFDLERIGMVDKMFFTRNLAVMIAAGLSLTKALDALANETTNAKFRKMIEDVNAEVIKGRSFADALRMHEKVFGNLFISMVEVGETTGKLVLVLKLAGNQMKKDYELRGRVKGALTYPSIIISTLLIVGYFMMTKVVPTLSQTIKEMGAPLPVSTQIIIAVSDALRAYSITVLLGLAALAAVLWQFLRTRRGKEILDQFIMRFPLIGHLVKKFNAARFCRIMAYLLASGVPIIRSLEITSNVLGNFKYSQAAADAVPAVQKGRALHEIFASHPDLFQPIVIQMMEVGEQTGKTADMLLRLAIFYEEEVNNTTKNLSTVIEPILMVIIGVAVGFFTISMMQPIYSSMGNI